LDKDSDGRVTGKEWGLQLVQEKEIMGKYFGGSTLKEIGTAFKRLDTNKDGSLSWDEFESALETWAAGGEVVAKMATAMAADEGAAEFLSLFEKLDKDADGKVSSQEWGRAVHAEQELMGKYFGGSTLKEIGSAFTRLDTNKDGALTWEEFKVAFAAYTEKQAKAFEAFDGLKIDSPSLCAASTSISLSLDVLSKLESLGLSPGVGPVKAVECAAAHSDDIKSASDADSDPKVIVAFESKDPKRIAAAAAADPEPAQALGQFLAKAAIDPVV
jgi:Ca2+-binding EF-hand superfamily protein